MTVDLAVELASGFNGALRLRNPVMTASGTFGYGTEYSGLVDLEALGAIVTPSVTLRPRKGYPQPRLLDAPGGVLTAIGLQNAGIQALIEEKAPIWATWSVPVLVSIAGETPEEYGELAARLEGIDGIAGLEVNLSPRFGDARPATDARGAAQVTRAVKDRTTLPLLVKLGLGGEDIALMAQATEGAGADALTVANAAQGMAIDLRSRRPALGSGVGELSGPSLKPMSLRAVFVAARAVQIPVIGCGGISNADDALEFLMAGASAVQVGTAVMVDPRTPGRIIQGIATYLERSGMADLREIVGVASR